MSIGICAFAYDSQGHRYDSYASVPELSNYIEMNSVSAPPSVDPTAVVTSDPSGFVKIDTTQGNIFLEAAPTVQLPNGESASFSCWKLRVDTKCPGGRWYDRKMGFARDAYGLVGLCYGMLAPSDLASIDQLIGSYMHFWCVSGLSLAIVKDERLVFAEAYGFSDREKHARTTPLDLFRIASVSKPITAIAVMKLIEGQVLSLDQKAFGSDGILFTDQDATPAKDPRAYDITVQNLLEHTSGWTTDPPDNLNITLEEAHEEHLKNEGLTFNPGERMCYLNWGYNILGRIIEAVTSQPYESYVKSTVLDPVGATDIHIGRGPRNQLRHNEVCYYDNRWDPYTISPTRHDASGGWIASPADLLRLIVRVDNGDVKPDILESATITTMTTPTTATACEGGVSNYAKGWAVTAEGWEHNGGTQGTAAWVMRQSDGFSWAIVVNTTPAMFLRELVRNILDSVAAWPSYDLFAPPSGQQDGLLGISPAFAKRWQREPKPTDFVSWETEPVQGSLEGSRSAHDLGRSDKRRKLETV